MAGFGTPRLRVTEERAMNSKRRLAMGLAAVLGTVTRRLELFDIEGNSLGFLALYNTIT